MARRRFFILDETCPVSEVAHMMGRVVKDKLLPLQRYAPVEPLLTSSERRHNSQDIIPGILPKPMTSVKRRDIVSSANDAKIKIHLTSFFGFDFAKGEEEQIELESEEVKRYTLNNLDHCFKKLMEDELYARDVRELLAETSNGRAYLVTGFLTVTGAVWTRSGSRVLSGGLDVTIPAAELAGAPTLSAINPRINPSRSSTITQKQTLNATEEEIFAVAYSVVKTSTSFDATSPNFVKKKTNLGPPKRASAKHLALGADSDEELELEEEEGTVELEPFDDEGIDSPGIDHSVQLDFDVSSDQ